MFVGEDQPKSRARSILLAGSSYLELGYGRFMQTDPIGYDDGLNWYNYVGGDPINYIDPTGLNYCTDQGLTTRDPGSSPGSSNDFAVIAPSCGGPISGLGGGSGGGGGAAPGGGGGGGPAPTPPHKNEITCTGPARVMAGNPRGVGKPGGMLRPINPGSAAIVPRQFPNGAGRGGSASPYLRSISPYIRGTTAGGQSFSGADDVINDGRIAPTAFDAQNIEMARDPGRLLIELVNGRDEGRTTTSVTVPGNSCPANTSPVGGK